MKDYHQEMQNDSYVEVSEEIGFEMFQVFVHNPLFITHSLFYTFIFYFVTSIQHSQEKDIWDTFCKTHFVCVCSCSLKRLYCKTS